MAELEWSLGSETGAFVPAAQVSKCYKGELILIVCIVLKFQQLSSDRFVRLLRLEAPSYSRSIQRINHTFSNCRNEIFLLRRSPRRYG
jgi:hypothetical protein